MSTGEGNDSITFGNGALAWHWAKFLNPVAIDGGDGTDVIDILGHGNVLLSTLDTPNVESVV
jgi:hypothetical protein